MLRHASCFNTLNYCKSRAWRYQTGNQNPYIEKGQTTKWPKEKVQKDKQRSTKHTHKTKDRINVWQDLSFNQALIHY